MTTTEEQPREAMAAQIEALALIRRRSIQAIGAGISTRNWHTVETAYNEARDAIDKMLRELPASVTALRQAEKLPAAEIVAQDRGDWQTISLQAEIDKGVGVEQWITQAEAAPGVVEALDGSQAITCAGFVRGGPYSGGFAEMWIGGRHFTAEQVVAALARQPTASPPIEVERTVADGALVLVPREPTEAMLRRGAQECFKVVPPMTMRSIWSAMIAAAPATDEGERG